MQNALKICCIMFILVGCREHISETSTGTANTTNTTQQSDETKADNFPIKQIIQNSSKRKSKYDLKNEFNDPSKLIQSDFFEKYLANYSIKNIKDFKIEFDKYSRYYFFDFVEFDKFVSFTIIHDDEVGYDNFYNYIYDKELNTITDVVMIASVGGDGGHVQEELLYYSNSMKDLLVITESRYDEDLFDEEHKNCYTRQTDIYETKYKFGKNNTKIIEGKVTITKDTLCQ